jgi:hypothetical protein
MSTDLDVLRVCAIVGEGTDPITFTHARSWFGQLTLSLSKGVDHTF